MFAVKLPANIVVASDCYIVLNMFEHVFTFHIFHIAWGINYNWSLLKANVQLKRTNQGCSPSKISQSLLNGALVMEVVNNSFSESKNFGRLIKQNGNLKSKGNLKYKNTLPLDFAQNNILVSECIFRLVCHCGNCWWSKIRCA